MRKAMYDYATSMYSCPSCACGCVPDEEVPGQLRCTGCQERYEPADRISLVKIKASMNSQDAVRLLEECTEGDDPELCHELADYILCLFLRQKGYTEVVEAYEKVRKWYG